MIPTLLQAEPNLQLANRGRRRRAVVLTIVGIFCVSAEMWAATVGPVAR